MGKAVPPRKQSNSKNKPKPVPINGNGSTLPMPKHLDAMSAVRAGESNTMVYPIPYEGKGVKRRVGRPSKYKEEYCDMLIEHMARGNPLESFAAKIHVEIKTLNNWMNEHDEFLLAKRLGEPKWFAWWIRMGTALVVDNPSCLLELMGAKPFVKKQTTAYLRNGLREVTEEFHVPRGSVGAYTYIMTNMFRHLGWRNDYRHEVTGKDGGPIQHQSKNVHLVANMTTDELRKLDALHTAVAERVAAEAIELKPAEVE